MHSVTAALRVTCDGSYGHGYNIIYYYVLYECVYINIYCLFKIIILYNKFMHAITLIKIFTFHIILLSLINMNGNIIHNTGPE